MRPVDGWIALEAADADPATRARWLERVVAGLELPAVIAELAAVAGGPAELAEMAPDAVRSWLGPDATAVLEEGLDRLPRRKVDELFRRPELLVGLQDLVLTEGGGRWHELIRQDRLTGTVAAGHRDVILRTLGLEAAAPRRGASPTRVLPAAAADRPAAPAATPRRLSPEARRRLFLLAPLAAAAAILVAVVFPTLRPQPPERSSPTDEARTAVVTAPAPDDAGVVGSGPVSDGSWPAHPWQELVLPEASRPPAAGDVLGRLTGSRDWSRRLDEARDLSATQVRAAAQRARDAVSAIETLAASGGIDFSDDGRTVVEAKCRTALRDLDHLQSAIGADERPGDGLARAKADIVRVLDDVEKTLVEFRPRRPAAHRPPAEDGPAAGPRPD